MCWRRKSVAWRPRRRSCVAVSRNPSFPLFCPECCITYALVNNHGVYSYGNMTPIGSSLADYIERQAPNRNTMVIVVPTTPEQDAAALVELNKFNGNMGKLSNNCSTWSNRALDAADIPRTFPFKFAENIPGTAGARGIASGAAIHWIPRGTQSVPRGLSSFEPK
jgi:hypothetical protein